MRRSLWLWLLVICCGSVSQGLTSLKHSCEIQIEIKPRKGSPKTIRFQAHLKTKKQCQALAKIHQRHFDQKKMASKKVSYHWTQQKKTIPTRF